MADRDWNALIEDFCQGAWLNPLTGKIAPASACKRILIERSLKGSEADCIIEAGFAGPFALICDPATHKALGERIARGLSRKGTVNEIILERPKADMAGVRDLAARLAGHGSVIAVGSGTVNDLTKYATLQNGADYCVFATAGSMDGYASATASITLDSGLKVSLPAQVPRAFFVDLEVCAAAPPRLNAAGFGDCVCRSVAQIDWWMSHRMLGTPYRHEPFLIEIPDEVELMERASGIAAGEVEAVGTLMRMAILSGLGTIFTGSSHHGSMGEHQISHYIDCFAGSRHPGTLHGEQVGRATITMARMQHRFLEREAPPVIGPTVIDEEDMARRMGAGPAGECAAEYRKKAFDEAGAERFNRKLARIWPQLREECLEMSVGPQRLEEKIAEAGGGTTAEAMDIPADLYREAVAHGHEMRNRFSFADIAAGSGELAEFAEAER